jgi:RecB family exonuclease
MIDLKHLSYSSISAYLDCPRKWKFRYIEKLPTFGNANLFLGSVWHNTVEEYISTSAKGTEALKKLYKKSWNVQLKKDGEKMIWDREEETVVKEQGEYWITEEVDTPGSHPSMADYLDTIKPKKGKKGEKPYVVEMYVSLNVPRISIPIIGFIDTITQDDIPTDFKTSGKSWSKTRAAAEMQPLFYLAALSQAGIRVPSGQFRHTVFVKPGKTTKPKVQEFITSHNQAKLFWIYRVIEDVWNAIQREAFPVNPTGWLCSKYYCDYWGSCRGKFEGV